MNSTAVVSYYVQALPVLQSVYKQMNFWLTILVLIPGVVLNLVMGSLFMRKRFWKSEHSIGYYYTVGPILSDACCIVGILNFFPLAFNSDLTLISEPTCKVIWYMRVFFVMGVEYFNVQMTIHRAVSIVYPRRFKWLTNPLNLAFITLFIYFVVSLYSLFQITRYFTYKTVVSGNMTTLVPASCRLSQWGIFFQNFSLFFLRSIGFLIILIANCVILKKLLESKKNFHRAPPSSSTAVTGSSHHQQSTMSKREFWFAVSLMSGNFVQIALVMPFFCVLVIQIAFTVNPNQPADVVAYSNVLYGIVNWGNYIFEALPFYINCLTNKVFRTELVRVFFKHKIGLMTNRGHSTVNQNMMVSQF